MVEVELVNLDHPTTRMLEVTHHEKAKALTLPASSCRRLPRVPARSSAPGHLGHQTLSLALILHPKRPNQPTTTSTRPYLLSPVAS